MQKYHYANSSVPSKYLTMTVPLQFLIPFAVRTAADFDEIPEKSDKGTGSLLC